MLKDMALEVVKRKCKNCVGKLFLIENALVKKTLSKWFNQKVKQKFRRINLIAKLRYKSHNQIHWKKMFHL